MGEAVIWTNDTQMKKDKWGSCNSNDTQYNGQIQMAK